MTALTVIAMLACIVGAGYADDIGRESLSCSLAICAVVLFFVLCIMGK